MSWPSDAGGCPVVSLVVKGHFSPGGWSLAPSAGVSALFGVDRTGDGRRESIGRGFRRPLDN